MENHLNKYMKMIKNIVYGYQKIKDIIMTQFFILLIF